MPDSEKAKDSKRHRRKGSNAYVKASPQGDLYIDADDIFKTENGRNILKEFLESDIYKNLRKKKKSGPTPTVD